MRWLQAGRLFAAAVSIYGVVFSVITASDHLAYGLALACVNGGLLGFNLTGYIKEKRHGSDREAEAHSQDSNGTPWDITHSITFTPGGTYYYTGPSGATASLTSGEPALDVVETDMPILAHRSAILRFDGTSRPFASITGDKRAFGVDADAYCAIASFGFVMYTSASPQHDGHSAPGVDCSCGFYALPPDIEATYEDCAYVTLMVELSGTVIEHEKGYRAGHQRVIECRLPPCPYCSRAADYAVVKNHVMTEATCAAHAPTGRRLVSFVDLAALLPVPVTRAGTHREIER